MPFINLLTWLLFFSFKWVINSATYLPFHYLHLWAESACVANIWGQKTLLVMLVASPQMCVREMHPKGQCLTWTFGEAASRDPQVVVGGGQTAWPSWSEWVCAQALPPRPPGVGTQAPRTTPLPTVGGASSGSEEPEGQLVLGSLLPKWWPQGSRLATWLWGRRQLRSAS